MNEPITAEWLTSVGIYPSDGGKLHPNDAPTEFAVRIVGGSDDGWMANSDDNKDGDEIADLVVALEGDKVSVYLETWSIPGQSTTAVIELGTRRTRDEILDLCRSLKAWSVKYPGG